MTLFIKRSSLAVRILDSRSSNGRLVIKWFGDILFLPFDNRSWYQTKIQMLG
jgi:hypothetical protein